MAPRPDVLEEPDFSKASLTSTLLWNQPSGYHGWTEVEFARAVMSNCLKPEDFHFLFSDHDISPIAEEWRPDSVLGKGGFGIAGLWRKQGPDQAVTDEMVIKQQTSWDPTREIAFHVQIEASTQRDAQKQAQTLLQLEAPEVPAQSSGDYPVVHLRNYKFNLPAKTCRYYLLYCPHNTLDGLIRTYRIWDQYLPELFVWHVTHSLAKAMLALKQPLDKSSLARNDDDFEDDCWIIHQDVKPDNIFLDYAPMRQDEIEGLYSSHPSKSAAAENSVDPTRTYPGIKLGDFGLAWYETSETVGHVARRGGTSTYLSPEHLNWGRWFSPENRPIDPTNPWGPIVDVYAVGRIIFDFCMYPSGKLNDVMGIGEEGFGDNFKETQYLKNGHHFLRRQLLDTLGGAYSSQLIMLMRRCLSPRPTDRPSPEELEQEALDGLRSARERAVAATSEAHDTGDVSPVNVPGWRVFYRPFEIEDMPLGTNKLKMSSRDHLVVEDGGKLDRILEIPPSRSPYHLKVPYVSQKDGELQFMQAPEVNAREFPKYGPDRLEASLEAERKVFERRREKRLKKREVDKAVNIAVKQARPTPANPAATQLKQVAERPTENATLYAPTHRLLAPGIRPADKPTAPKSARAKSARATEVISASNRPRDGSTNRSAHRKNQRQIEADAILANLLADLKNFPTANPAEAQRGRANKAAKPGSKPKGVSKSLSASRTSIQQVKASAILAALSADLKEPAPTAVPSSGRHWNKYSSESQQGVAHPHPALAINSDDSSDSDAGQRLNREVRRNGLADKQAKEKSPDFKIIKPYLKHKMGGASNGQLDQEAAETPQATVAQTGTQSAQDTVNISPGTATADTAAAAPTLTNYASMTVKKLEREIRARKLAKPQPAKGKRHVRKSDYIRVLQVADQARP